jgi:hypothetical protein
VEFTVEPWAHKGSLKAGGELLFRLEGDNSTMEFVWVEEGPLFYVWADRIRLSSDGEVFDFEAPESHLGKPPPGDLKTFAIIFRGAEFG